MTGVFRQTAMVVVLLSGMAFYLTPTRAAAAASSPIHHIRSTVARGASSITGPKTAISGPSTALLPPKISGPQVGFGGSNSSTTTPPDTNIAVGNNEVVQVVNSTISIWSESGTAGPSESLATFFNAVVNGPANAGETDSRVFWDSDSQRWYVSGLLYDTSQSSPSCDSTVMLGVSTGVNPDWTQPLSWNIYVAKKVTGDLQDQPRLGVDHDKILLSWDDYTDPVGGCASGSSTYSTAASLFVVNKAMADAGTLDCTISSDCAFPVGYQQNSSEFGIVGIDSITSTTTGWAVWNTESGYLGVIKVTGLPGSLVASESDLPVASDSTISQACACTPGPGGSVDLGDARVLSAMQQNNDIWLSTNDTCTGNSTMGCTRLIEVGVSGAPSIEQNFDPSTTGEIYPAVTFDGNHNLFVVATHVTSTVSQSVDEMFLANGAATSSLTVGTIEAGGGNYQGISGETAPYRWGDYSGAAIDPGNTYQVWLAGEYVASTGHSWSTWIAPETWSGGQVVDAYGHVSKFGAASSLSLSYTPWSFKIIHSMAINSDGLGGVVLDGYGGLHPFGNVTSAYSDSAWPGWDIARFMATDGSGAGYYADAYGGLHRYKTGNAALPPAPVNYAYWGGWNICRGLVEFSDGKGGITLDGFGGLHAWGVAGSPTPSPAVQDFWWGNPAFDIARAVVLNPGSTYNNYSGYVLDGYGGLHPFYGGSASKPAQPSGDATHYWPGFDIARALTLVNGSSGAGWVLDGYGGMHPFGGAPSVVVSAYTPGQDIAKTTATTQ